MIYTSLLSIIFIYASYPYPMNSVMFLNPKKFTSLGKQVNAYRISAQERHSL